MSRGDPSDDPVIDQALVRRLVASQFPAWADLPVTPVKPGGWDNRTFRLGNKMSVRLPSAARYARQVEKEHRWLPILATGLPLLVPSPLVRGNPTDEYPWPWSVYQWLEGEPATAPDIDLMELARSLAGFLAALQKIDTTDAPHADRTNFWRGGSLSVYDAEVRNAIAVLGNRIDASAVRQIWREALATEWSQPPVWVHGDIAASNLLIADGKLCAVIDFGCCAVGDPACDLAIAWNHFSTQSTGVFKQLLNLDEDTWARARGWALWKALITAAGPLDKARDASHCWRVIDNLVGSY